MTAVVVSTLAMSAGAASAARPEKAHFEGVFDFTDTTLCDFPVELTVTYSIDDIAFFTKAGELRRVHTHVKEQDTFVANGTTLVGDTYTGNQVFLFSPTGELTAAHFTGLLEKVRLPDGSIFMGAGRVDVLAADPGFIVAPDSGVAKNQDAFCAALSG